MKAALFWTLCWMEVKCCNLVSRWLKLWYFRFSPPYCSTILAYHLLKTFGRLPSDAFSFHTSSIRAEVAISSDLLYVTFEFSKYAFGVEFGRITAHHWLKNWKPLKMAKNHQMWKNSPPKESENENKNGQKNTKMFTREVFFTWKFYCFWCFLIFLPGNSIFHPICTVIPTCVMPVPIYHKFLAYLWS